VVVVDGGKVNVHPPEYYHDVNNCGMPFEKAKRHHLEQALQQVHDRNGPKAKRIIDMILTPPLVLHLSLMMTTEPSLM
jgi:hypothetical protein